CHRLAWPNNSTGIPRAACSSIPPSIGVSPKCRRLSLPSATGVWLRFASCRDPLRRVGRAPRYGSLHDADDDLAARFGISQIARAWAKAGTIWLWMAGDGALTAVARRTASHSSSTDHLVGLKLDDGCVQSLSPMPSSR